MCWIYGTLNKPSIWLILTSFTGVYLFSLGLFSVLVLLLEQWIPLKLLLFTGLLGKYLIKFRLKICFVWLLSYILWKYVRVILCGSFFFSPRLNITYSLSEDAENKREESGFLTTLEFANLLQWLYKTKEICLWSSGGMILTGPHGSTRTETCPVVVLSTTNPKWPGVA